MEFDWDEQKRAANPAKHGIDFRDAASLAWETAQVLIDNRRNYGEARYQATGFETVALCHRLHPARRQDTAHQFWQSE